MEINLDENEIYDLSELTSEELQELAKYMQINHGWEYQVPHTDLFWHDASETWLYNKFEKVNDMVNAKELFYTLENIQVDCRELSEEQIKEMADVFNTNGYETWDNINALKKDTHLFLEVGIGNEVYLNHKKEEKTTITYEKFMDLFGEKDKLPPYKETPLKWNYETLVGDNQVVIEHTKEFIPSKKQVLKYLLKKDIILTPKQYKKLWKGL